MHKVLHHERLLRLHVSRKVGGKELASIETIALMHQCWGLDDYIKKRQKRLITKANISVNNINANRKTTKT